MCTEAQRYVEWLDSERQNRDQYHHHKELMAWAATAFYIPLVVVFANAVHERLSLWQWIPVGGLLLLVGVAAWVFVHMQFRQRREAASTCWALMRARVHILADPARVADLEKDLPEHDPEDLSKGKHPPLWPGFVQKRIDEECTLKRPFWSVASFCGDPRVQSEDATYFLLWVATAVAIGAL